MGATESKDLFSKVREKGGATETKVELERVLIAKFEKAAELLN